MTNDGLSPDVNADKQTMRCFAMESDPAVAAIPSAATFCLGAFLMHVSFSPTDQYDGKRQAGKRGEKSLRDFFFLQTFNFISMSCGVVSPP